MYIQEKAKAKPRGNPTGCEPVRILLPPYLDAFQYPQTASEPLSVTPDANDFCVVDA